MKKVVISPYSNVLSIEKTNPKNYPYWKEVVRLLKNNNIQTIHITNRDNESIGAEVVKCNLSFKEIEKLLLETNTWVSIDSFLVHLAHSINKIGVAIYSVSDPLIFGYEENINLIKDRKFLRENQFDNWHVCDYNLEAFIEPGMVCSAIKSLII